MYNTFHNNKRITGCGGKYMTYILYCDESADSGPKFSDFFGGCILNSEDLHKVQTALETRKKELNLFSEIKWTKVTDNYLEKYINIIDLFFDFIAQGKIKVRIMFRKTDDVFVRSGSTVDDKYFKLYYQFLKHGFGLKDIPPECTPANLIVYLDTLPDKHGKRDEFKRYLSHLPQIADFASADITIRPRDIIEVDSHDHVLLQCTDIILGSMYFKLNEFNKQKPDGQHRRGKKTIAKEKLYKHILARIQEIVPGFNIGVSTGSHGFINPHWESPYEHWLFKSKN